MKKLLCLLLTISVLFAFSGCDQEQNKDNSSTPSQYVHSTNILAYAEKGEIPEVPFKLGESIETVEANFSSTLPEGDEMAHLFITEGELTVQMEGGSSMFFYEKANKESGVSVIVAKAEAFKLSMGGIYRGEDIIDMIDSEDYTRTTATDADVFFLPGSADQYECITYKTGDFILKFILTDGYACATTLTNPAVWNYK